MSIVSIKKDAENGKFIAEQNKNFGDLKDFDYKDVVNGKYFEGIEPSLAHLIKINVDGELSQTNLPGYNANLLHCLNLNRADT